MINVITVIVWKLLDSGICLIVSIAFTFGIIWSVGFDFMTTQQLRETATRPYTFRIDAWPGSDEYKSNIHLHRAGFYGILRTLV